VRAGDIVSLTPGLSIRLVDRFKQSLKTGSLINRPALLQAAAQAIEITLREQTYADYTFARHLSPTCSRG
jgi:hypothetical protein